jgi:hypothetical protein
MEEGRYEKSTACLRFDSELEAYLEGETRPFIAVHAQDCPFCHVLLTDLEQIRQAAREMPLEEPSPVVWANLRARLDAEGVFLPHVSAWRKLVAWHSLPHPAPMGVLAGLVILASVLTMPPRSTQRWDIPEAATTSPATITAPAVSTSQDSALARLVDELESNYRANEASLAPDLKATYEKSLVSLDGSIQECLDSLQHEPRNTLAHDYLLTAYTRKAEMLSSALEFEGR